MALTIQQQIAQQAQDMADRKRAIIDFRKRSQGERRDLREERRARGAPKGFNAEMSALVARQRADPLGFALGKSSTGAVGMGTRDLRRGIASLQRQVSRPFSQLKNLVKGGNDQLVQKGLSGQADLGDIAVSVSGRKPLSLQKAASKYGMSVPQFLQMNPQYAGRDQLSPGEIYKIAGQSASLPDQLEAQQMRYDATASPETAQNLTPFSLGLQGAYQANPYGDESFQPLGLSSFSNPYGGFSNPYGGFSNPYGGFSQAGPTMAPMDDPQAGSMVPNMAPTGMPRGGFSNPTYSGIGSFVTQGIGLGSQNLYNAPMASFLSSQPPTGTPSTGGVF